MIKTVIVVIALSIAAAPASAEELYRWVDKDGKVHFGDRPPLDAEAKNIEGKLRPVNTADASASQNGTTTARQQTDPQKEYWNKQQRRQAGQQQQRARACQNARRQLRLLQGPVAFTGESGKEIKITERERQQMAERLQGEVDRICG